MFENQNNGLLIQTEDSFLRKESDAVGKIGGHLLITALYKNGAVIGNRFDDRQNEERQWIKQIGSSSLILGLGQQGAFDSFCHAADSLKLTITSNILPERYVTLSLYDKFLTPVIRSSFEAGKPMPLEIMYVSLRSSKLLKIKRVQFNGDSALYSGFGVLGGYGFMDPQKPIRITKEQTAGKTAEQVDEMVQALAEQNYKIPVKDAVKKMESYYGDRKCLETMNEAMDSVRETLFECDPPSKKEMFEFTVFEKGALESIYVPRTKKDAAKIKIKSE